MASSKVMASTPNPPRKTSPSTSTHYVAKNYSPINMDQIINNIYPAPQSLPLPQAAAVSPGKTPDEVWKQIISGRETMTLEDFLTKAVGEEEVRAPAVATAAVAVGYPHPPDAVMVHGSTVVVGHGSGVGGGGRGKRRVMVEEAPMDKATQQKQRRMIKNRESAARSRERKQAYTIELEALVVQLEEENARLLKEEAEESKKRYKQLMENLVPVEDRQKPPKFQALRRTNSM